MFIRVRVKCTYVEYASQYRRLTDHRHKQARTLYERCIKTFKYQSQLSHVYPIPATSYALLGMFQYSPCRFAVSRPLTLTTRFVQTGLSSILCNYKDDGGLFQRPNQSSSGPDAEGVVHTEEVELEQARREATTIVLRMLDECAHLCTALHAPTHFCQQLTQDLYASFLVANVK